MTGSTDENWLRLVSTDDIDQGEVLGLEVEGKSIAIYRLEDDSYFATDNVCTHAQAFLSDGWLEGDIIECPLHGGCFNVRTGAGCGGPITVDLKTYPIRIDGDDIFIQLDG
jgi:3-phenylpropionate/trans-cinnamate dioxygenase ferredoxin component